MRSSTGSDATYEDRYGVSDDFIYDLDKCLSWPEKVFIATFPQKYTWDNSYQLVSRNKASKSRVLGRLNNDGHLVVSVCVRSARYKKIGDKVKRPGSIIRSIRLDRMSFTMTYGPIPPNCYIGHIDGNKANNHPGNLELRLLRNHAVVPDGVYEPPNGPVSPNQIDLSPLRGFSDIDKLKTYLSGRF